MIMSYMSMVECIAKNMYSGIRFCVFLLLVIHIDRVYIVNHVHVYGSLYMYICMIYMYVRLRTAMRISHRPRCKNESHAVHIHMYVYSCM